MGMFDALINSNKEPKFGMEYIYLLDVAWIIGTFDTVSVDFGCIMTDVVKLPNDSFEFTHKETGKRYRTNYGWALAENTPENVERINAYLESNKKLKEVEKENSRLRNLIIDLDGPKKI
jgi:hypothetical protein